MAGAGSLRDSTEQSVAHGPGRAVRLCTALHRLRRPIGFACPGLFDCGPDAGCRHLAGRIQRSVRPRRLHRYLRGACASWWTSTNDIERCDHLVWPHETKSNQINGPYRPSVPVHRRDGIGGAQPAAPDGAAGTRCAAGLRLDRTDPGNDTTGIADACRGNLLGAIRRSCILILLAGCAPASPPARRPACLRAAGADSASPEACRPSSLLAGSRVTRPSGRRPPALRGRGGCNCRAAPDGR